MFKFMNRVKNNKGFTLVELIIVIAIIGILAGLAVPKLSSFNERAREATDEANARVIASVIAIQAADGELSDATSATAVAGEDDIEDMLPNSATPEIVSDAYDGAANDFEFYYINDPDDGIVIYGGNGSSPAGIVIYPK